MKIHATPNCRPYRAALQTLLTRAGSVLNDTSLTPGMSFASSLIILLREGPEAILVHAAIAAFLIKTGRRDAMKYLHFGWVSALMMGFVTWIIASNVISISGAVALILPSWLNFTFSVRLPLKLFFNVNAVLLVVLAVVFAGKGIAALQEAGKLPSSHVNFPGIDLLGIYPNLQGLGVQAALLALALGL